MWPFSKGRKEASSPNRLTFKDGQSFFEYQCKYGHTQIEPRVAIPALVLDSKERFQVPTAIAITEDGRQLAALLVASPEGGFLVFATTPSSRGNKLAPGDVVLWVPEFHSPEIGTKSTDSRTGWVGKIRAKIETVIDLQNPEFIVSYRYE